MMRLLSMSSHRASPRVLICDFHVGCQLWQAAALEQLGASARVLSLSAHSYLLPPQMPSISRVERRFISRLRTLWGDGWRGWCWPEDVLRLLSDRQIARYLDSYDCFVCSFPPSLAVVFFHLAQHLGKRVIVNAGHRWDMGLRSQTQRVVLEGILRRIYESDRHVLGVMADYDSHYMRYYLGIDPVGLPVSCHHVPLTRLRPDRDELLVGPVHARNLGVAHSGDDLDRTARIRLGMNGATRPWCVHIRDAYPTYKLEELRRHRGVILFPYSAFSISMVELYELNLPMFVPAPHLLVEHQLLDDRVLFPIYCSEKEFRDQFRPPRCEEYSGSPNSYDPQACYEWFRYCFFFRKDHVVTWNSVDDLIAKVESTDLSQIRERMHVENMQTRQESLDAWRAVVHD